MVSHQVLCCTYWTWWIIYYISLRLKGRSPINLADHLTFILLASRIHVPKFICVVIIYQLVQLFYIDNTELLWLGLFMRPFNQIVMEGTIPRNGFWYDRLPQNTQKEKQKCLILHYILMVVFHTNTKVDWKAVNILTSHGDKYACLTVDLIIFPNCAMETSPKKSGKEFIPVTSWIEHVIFLLPIMLTVSVPFKEYVGKNI